MEMQAAYTIDDVKREAAGETHKHDVSERMQLIIFKLGSEEYGLSIDQIKEVVLTPKIAKMPQTPDYIKGVANIRGNIIAIMDLEERFNLKRANKNTIEGSNYTLVVESEDYKVGVLVKEVPNTLSIGVSEIDTASNFVQYSSLDNNSIKGVVKSGERLIILIDMLKLVETENFKDAVNQIKKQ